MSDYVIKVENAEKSFNIKRLNRTTLVDRLTHPFANPDNKLHVLQDISFHVERGEFLGIIGRNGCGKSTLLKLLAGIYLPDSGKIKINGKMVPFLELGVGFDPDLSAADNIFLNGTILGMRRKIIEACFDDIIEFAGLEDFVNTPLKNFSSGMKVRLAFSIAIKSMADIYILDEVIAVGDINFREKSFAEFEKFRGQGKTIIFVSHSLDLIRNFCDKVLLIEKGKIAKYGDPDSVVDYYEKTN